MYKRQSSWWVTYLDLSIYHAEVSGYVDVNIPAHLLPLFLPSIPRCSLSFPDAIRLYMFLLPVYPPFFLFKHSLAAVFSIINRVYIVPRSQSSRLLGLFSLDLSIRPSSPTHVETLAARALSLCTFQENGVAGLCGVVAG